MADDGLVIVGAGLAGAKAAEAARSSGWEGAIRLVGAEAHLPYERPPLSKGVLSGHDRPTVAAVHESGFYVTNEIDLLIGAAAEALDLQARTVTLTGGRRLTFAKLVLATGSTPRRLPVPGMDLDGVFTLRTLDDSLALREELRAGRRVCVVGASWIGTEVAAAARERGCDVVMVDPLATPLERVLGAEVGGYFAVLHADHSVDLRMGTGLEAIEGSDRVSGVRLDDGEVVDADVVVVGVGVVADIALAEEAGLETASGVLVDSHLRTSHPDVYAAGDIAEAEHPVLGRRVRVEHWANALNQGRTAGTNAAGGSKVYDRIPYFFSDQYDAGMEYSGWPVPYDDVVFRGDPSDGEFVAFYLAGGLVVGGINVNVWDVNEAVQALIRSRTAVDTAVLADPDTDPKAWLPAG
ncbi:MAG: FAD-dependent oxidoreductase [Acidimicrobiia bacterium]|nr:FAD-dependent oxidoreductase [Acidimicrobiia bacterium]